MVIHAWRCDFVLFLSRFIHKFAISFHTFLCMTFHVVGPRRYRFGIKFSRCFYVADNFSVAPTDILDSNIIRNILANLTFSLCAIQINVIENDVGSPKSTSFTRIFQVGSMFSVLQTSFISSTYTDRNSPLARLTNKHSQFKTFSQPCSKRAFSNCLSHNSPARG